MYTVKLHKPALSANSLFIKTFVHDKRQSEMPSGTLALLEAWVDRAEEEWHNFLNPPYDPELQGSPEFKPFDLHFLPAVTHATFAAELVSAWRWDFGAVRRWEDQSSAHREQATENEPNAQNVRLALLGNRLFDLVAKMVKHLNHPTSSRMFFSYAEHLTDVVCFPSFRQNEFLELKRKVARNLATHLVSEAREIEARLKQQ